jgi:probable addiction module antidote protein
MPKARPFDAAKYRDDPRAIAEYLNDALSTGDPVLIIKAIGDMVRAQGVTRFAQRAGLRRDNLYRTFGDERSPAFDTVVNILTALDLRLAAKFERRIPDPGLRRKGRFSLKEDRQLIQIAAASVTVEEAAAIFRTSVEMIEQKAGKLGIPLSARNGRKRLSARFSDLGLRAKGK